jgi:hypothetical protein
MLHFELRMCPVLIKVFTLSFGTFLAAPLN